MTTPYDALPPLPTGGRRGWGQFGPDDEIGRLHLASPDRVAAAARLVERGVAFPLDLPWGTFDPPLNPARGNPRHHVIEQPGGIGLDDVWDNLYPQAGSQWDSLAHIGLDREVYYNGASHAEVRDTERNAIHRWAERGVAGRAVLLDLPRVYADSGREHSPSATIEYSPEDLDAARELAGVQWEAGDIVLLHTGFTHWYRQQPREVRKALPGQVRTPGLAHTEEVCAYLWDARVAAVASDNFAVEAWPADTSVGAAPFGFLHQMLIGSFGMALGELWWLHDLALDCREHGTYTGLLVSSPAHAPGGISSPANAIVLK